MEVCMRTDKESAFEVDPETGELVQVRSWLDASGKERPNDVPLAPPVGFHHPPSLIDMIRRHVKSELSLRASDAGYETFEEADDFDVPDDPIDPQSPYEVVFEPPLPEPQSRSGGPAGKGGANTPPPAKVSGEPSPGGQSEPKSSPAALLPDSKGKA